MDNNKIFKYLDIRNKNKHTTDEEFDELIINLPNDIYNYGFDNLINYYNKNKLKNIEKDWDNLRKYKKYTIENKLINNISSTNILGTKIIKKHMIHIYDVENFKGMSIKKSFTINNIEKVLRINRKSHSSTYISEIIRQLGFISGCSKVTIYRPLLTKIIVNYYNCKNVLDVCVGWGGRMLGSVSIDNVNYTGIEPCIKTFNGLKSIENELKLKNIILYNDTAQNILPKLKKEYDLAITSPPYFNLEIYSDENNQSYTNNMSYDEWKCNFLLPVVEGVLDKLKDDGISCWSVKNFKTNEKCNLYDDIVEIHKKKGWCKLEQEFYVGNCIRPGIDNKGKEITYIFKKN